MNDVLEKLGSVSEARNHAIRAIDRQIIKQLDDAAAQKLMADNVEVDNENEHDSSNDDEEEQEEESEDQFSISGEDDCGASAMLKITAMARLRFQKINLDDPDEKWLSNFLCRSAKYMEPLGITPTGLISKKKNSRPPKDLCKRKPALPSDHPVDFCLMKHRDDPFWE